jgi:hypothetical protein
MVATIPTPPQGGMVGILQFEGSSSSINIMMCDQTVKLQIQACNYDIVTHQNVTLKCRIYLHLSVASVVKCRMHLIKCRMHFVKCHMHLTKCHIKFSKCRNH